MIKKKLIRHKLIYEEVLKQVQKEDIAFFSECTKFRPHQKQLSIDRAIQYLCLKDNKVNRKDALRFGQRRVCKIDSTRLLDGPPKNRLLKTKKIPQGVVNGWYNGTSDPQYDLGSDYQTDLANKMLNNEDEVHYQEFMRNESIYQEQQQKQIDQVLNFNLEMEQKCKFTGLSPDKLIDKLNKVKEENRKRNEQHTQYVEYKGQRFYYILRDIDDYLMKKNQKQTILQEMRSFSSLTSLNKRLVVKKLEPGEPLTEREHRQSQIQQQQQDKQLRTDRTYTTQFNSLNSEDFNNAKYIFKVSQIPTATQQTKQPIYNKILQLLIENSMKTPRDALSPTTSNSRKSESSSKKLINLEPEPLKQIGRKSQFFLNIPTEQSSINNQVPLIKKIQSKSKSMRFQSVLQQQIQKQDTIKDKMESLTFQSSPTIDRLDSPNKRAKYLDGKLNQYIKNKFNSSTPREIEVDTTILKQRYKQLQERREKEIQRVFKNTNQKPQTANSDIFTL